MTRKTYHYDAATKTMVEGPAQRRGESGDGWRYSDRVYSGQPFTAHDGTVIDSRKKHRDYMKRHGLTTVDDYKGTWAEAAREREAIQTGKHDRAGRVNDLARAWEKHR